MTLRENFRVGRLLLAALLVGGAAGCATKGDVQRIEAQLGDLRMQSAEGDSAGAALLAQLIRELQATQLESRSYLDSLRSELTGIRSTSAELRGTVRDMQRQLTTIEELTGQIQARLGQLESQLRNQERAPPSYQSDTATGDEVTQLIDAGIRFSRSGSPATARAAFSNVIDNFPEHPGVSEALYLLGDSFLGSGEPDSADVYLQRLTNEYPLSSRVPEAMYKRGGIAELWGDSKRARELFRAVADDFPTSDAGRLAAARLRGDL